MKGREPRAVERHRIAEPMNEVREQAAQRTQAHEPERTISAAKLAANRANSQLSTGPKTDAGKAVSSGNSFKHGLYSKQLVVEGEDPAELDAFRASLHAEHQPQTETECLLVNEMADQHWRLRRARRLEVQLFDDGGKIAHLNVVQRMMSSAERGFFKALKTLTELQKARGFVPQKADVEEVAATTGVSEHTPTPLQLLTADNLAANQPVPAELAAPCTHDCLTHAA